MPTLIPTYALTPEGVCTCARGAECGSPGKHPTVKGWAAEEYTPPDDINPEHAALRTDDLVVVDCDTMDAAAEWLELEPNAVHTPQVKTGNGMHFYYARPEHPPEELHSDSKVADNVDIKTGPGSYVMAPGSRHYSGAHYEWVGDSEQRELQPMPELVVKLLSKVRSGTSSTLAGPGSAELEWEAIPAGRRNTTLAAFAGTFRKQGMELGVLYALLKSINRAFCQPPLPDEEIQVIARSVSRYEVDPNLGEITLVGDDIEVISAAAMDAPPPRTWLWDPYIPDCTMTLVSGREGIGKGLFCAYLARCVASGEHPDGSEHEPKKVLWLTAEDHPHLDIWPRLRAAGWDPEEHADVHFTDPRTLIVLPDDITALRDLIETEGYGLVIMDPGRSYIGTRDPKAAAAFTYNNEAALRPAMQQLVYMSADLRMPMVFVGHWKKGEGPTRDQTSGSLAWKQVVRHALDFAEEEEQHALWVGKSNSGQKGYVRGYEIEGDDEWESARIIIGEELPFTTLDGWIKDVKERGSVTDLGVLLGIAVQYGETTLSPGDLFPAPSDMGELIPGLPKDKRTCELITESLVREGTIEKQGKSWIWRGEQPAVGS